MYRFRYVSHAIHVSFDIRTTIDYKVYFIINDTTENWVKSVLQKFHLYHYFIMYFIGSFAWSLKTICARLLCSFGSIYRFNLIEF